MKQIGKLLIEEFKNNNVNFDAKPIGDYVDDSFTDVLKSVIGVVKKLNYIPCCTELKDKNSTTIKDFAIELLDIADNPQNSNKEWKKVVLENAITKIQEEIENL